MKINIWDIYSHTYDTATMNFSAYQELLKKVDKKLLIRNKDKILNAGCGTGNLEKEIQKNEVDFDWIGCDISESMTNRARNKLHGDSRFKFQILDINDELPFQNTEFNQIVCVHALYTTKDVKKILKEFNRILKDDGNLIIVNPKKGAKMGKLFSYELKNNRNIIKFSFLLVRVIPAIIINMIISSRVRKSVFHFLSFEELMDMLEKSGFRVESSDTLYADQSLFITSRKR